MAREHIQYTYTWKMVASVDEQLIGRMQTIYIYIMSNMENIFQNCYIIELNVWASSHLAFTCIPTHVSSDQLWLHLTFLHYMQ